MKFAHELNLPYFLFSFLNVVIPNLIDMNLFHCKRRNRYSFFCINNFQISNWFLYQIHFLFPSNTRIHVTNLWNAAKVIIFEFHRIWNGTKFKHEISSVFSFTTIFCFSWIVDLMYNVWSLLHETYWNVQYDILLKSWTQ